MHDCIFLVPLKFLTYTHTHTLHALLFPEEFLASLPNTPQMACIHCKMILSNRIDGLKASTLTVSFLL